MRNLPVEGMAGMAGSPKAIHQSPLACRAEIAAVAALISILSGCIAGPRSAPLAVARAGRIAVLPVTKADLSGRVGLVSMSVVARDAIAHHVQGGKTLIGPEQFTRELENAGYGGPLAAYVNADDPVAAAERLPLVSRAAAASGYTTLLRITLTGGEKQDAGAAMVLFLFMAEGSVRATVSEYRAGEARPLRIADCKAKYSYAAGLLGIVPFAIGTSASSAADEAIHQAMTRLRAPEVAPRR